MTIKTWIKAFRLRTLPLSVSNVIVGNVLGWSLGRNSYSIAVYSFLTILCLQILSNLANDLGDTLKGVDNSNRVGPTRAVQSGEISIASMKKMIAFFILLSLLFGVLLITSSFFQNNMEESPSSSGLYIMIFAGIAAIIAALFYTLGKRPYGYYGLGDIFVFLFFGPVGVIGTYYLHGHSLSFPIILPAISIGLLSTGVLNCNNVRDIENDKLYNKITIPVRIGHRLAIVYQYFLVIGGLVTMSLFCFFYSHSYWSFLILLSFPSFFIHLKIFATAKNKKDYDPELKRLALSTFLLTILFVTGYLIGK